MHPSLDWDRVQRAVFQEVRDNRLPMKRWREAMRLLPGLLDLCGPFSRTRRMANRIGIAYVRGGSPQIIVPTCPAYPTRRGRFTAITGLGTGVSLVTKRHLPFLQSVLAFMPKARVQILVADQEANDPALCAAAGISREEFLARVMKTIEHTRELVAPFGWQVDAMTDFVPNLLTLEKEAYQWITETAAFAGHIATDAAARSAFYRLINPRFTVAQKKQRTAHTAAQYVALGWLAEEHGWLVCNHTTTNLAWYLKTGVGLLHNPVRVY